uniref:CRF3 n=1 Tax=Arundo donax TaxID=35708 RepID=A0A0A9S409_ARUDO
MHNHHQFMESEMLQMFTLVSHNCRKQAGGSGYSDW